MVLYTECPLLRMTELTSSTWPGYKNFKKMFIHLKSVGNVMVTFTNTNNGDKSLPGQNVKGKVYLLFQNRVSEAPNIWQLEFSQVVQISTKLVIKDVTVDNFNCKIRTELVFNMLCSILLAVLASQVIVPAADDDESNAIESDIFSILCCLFFQLLAKL